MPVIEGEEKGAVSIQWSSETTQRTLQAYDSSSETEGQRTQTRGE